MKSGRHLSRGFTIVETMIYLAVTSLLLVSALGLVAGSQNKTEFNTAINQLNQQIGDVINNVANGYYANINNVATNWTCSGSSGTPSFSNTTGGGKGTNQGCIFVGRAMKFSDSEEKFYIFNMAGVRQVDDGSGNKHEVTNMKESQPVAITQIHHGHSFPETVETIPLQSGLKVAAIQYKANAGVQNTGGMVFYSTLATLNDKGQLKNGSQSVNFAPIPNNNLGDDSEAFVGKVEDFSRSTGSYLGAGYEDASYGYKNPTGGIWICVNSGSTDQHGTIMIGGPNSQGATVLKIHNGRCESDGTEFGQ